MPKFREAPPPPPPPPPPTLLANRYIIHQRLGKGSFGTVYLIEDTKTSTDKLKVLKEIPLGDLKPDETVKATQEAQLLSQLHHPAILRFYTSFLERDMFCIVTEFCEDGDLECTLERLRVSGEALCESQVSEWLVQLLLGLDYMHQRRILHRDLKTKNIFLKRNMVKIGDFGVSCLLMGSCDLATTFTGTPYYMSPEALGHQGYDSKSDVWSLGCILYEMCCLKHAFEGHNFLSVVQKIMESSTPSLPEKYSPELNSLMQRMLERSPSLRVSAAEALSSDVIKELAQRVKQQQLSEETAGDDRDASHIASVLQKKVHLQTLRERSEVEKMSPRERMRLRKQQAADERARKLKHIVEEKYKENQQRMMELRCKNFQRLSINVFTTSLRTLRLQKCIILKMDLSRVLMKMISVLMFPHRTVIWRLCCDTWRMCWRTNPWVKLTEACLTRVCTERSTAAWIKSVREDLFHLKTLKENFTELTL
ncbi:serine/threonine-protein kinase Nek11 isoform X4 [Hemibagrus wyckioides]|uniref:serine/threonine-protein kinase Nek11 isoform X4 n=1 Tax=Hemibagrus wyckioides TaxID=337641 RepID=UPI00266BAAC0|nr:serine/threonine-protein kinase Nek11 isoform X4 [Hemibagrus wyckioides]